MGESGRKRKEEGAGAGASILVEKEMTVQWLSSTASEKSMKYDKIGPLEFVPYEYEIVSLEKIMKACHFYRRLPESEMDCNVLV